MVGHQGMNLEASMQPRSKILSCVSIQRVVLLLLSLLLLLPCSEEEEMLCSFL
jgi:hypothetical protein